MRLTLLSLISVLLFISCVQEEVTEVVYEGPETDVATAVIHPTEGNEASGIVTFTQENDGVRVHAVVSGLDAESLHGFHIHQFGDCRAPDGTSAGGHYNPTGMEHGAPTDEERHMGDLGNLPADEDGVATLEYLDEKIQLNGEHSIIGYGVIVHAGQDDLVSQPTGDAGGRIGCGVIGVANPEI